MITEIANFATEPEFKRVLIGETEKSVMNGRIAIRQGRERAAFVNVTAWGRLAEYIGAYYKKGDEIYIEGELRNSSYKTEGRVLQTNYILVTAAKPTFGQKSRRQTAESEPDEPEIPPESEPAEPAAPKPSRRRKPAADSDDGE
jgi:single-strand DNA-binding protein